MFGGNTNNLTYTYDAYGNILSISNAGVLQVEYFYDSDNQLIRENSAVQNKTFTYEYDPNGNIDWKKEYAYTTADLTGLNPTSVIDYSYGDHDMLTYYNGKHIAYDQEGNIRSYDNRIYTWNRGKLVGVTSTNVSMAAAYTYNANGIRTSKVVNGVATYFTLDGYTIDAETCGSTTVDYVYDSNGAPVYMTLNGTTYYYQKNLQGDIIGIVDSDNVEVVTYSYDAWGKLLSISGPLASTVGEANHLRYRGYYYDTESGLYYLQSRYYDPEIGKFISKDDPALHEGQTGVTANLYAYCNNNPIMYSDRTGHFGTPIQWAMAAVGAIAGWFFGDYVARRLGYASGWKYWAIRAGVVIGGAVIGWFAGTAIKGVATAFLKANPAVLAKLPGPIRWFLGLGTTGATVSTKFDPGKLFNTFEAAKKFLGSPGSGRQWHHIVEQSQISKSGFAANKINSLGNLISVPTKIHQQISAHYSSKLAFTGGKTVRDWLAGQSFQKQYEYGLKILKQFGVIK